MVGIGEVHLDVVVFDELSGRHVIDQKKLFQYANGPIELGCSTTNCHAYTVYVHKKKFVICTNTWQADIDGMPHCDRSWLVSNAVVLSVNTPMWEDAEDTSLPP